ncbi:MAG TPA: hypothetical protein VHD60_04175 [Candidatus Saccharimonadales bacterium]|nr:hypothetical protein [Candidatus Saccharimonadales bacterium]
MFDLRSMAREGVRQRYEDAAVAAVCDAAGSVGLEPPLTNVELFALSGVLGRVPPDTDEEFMVRAGLAAVNFYAEEGRPVEPRLLELQRVRATAGEILKRQGIRHPDD